MTLILEACTVTDAADERFSQLGAMITAAAEHLAAAQGHLQGIHDTAADLASLLFPATVEDLGDGPGRGW